MLYKLISSYEITNEAKTEFNEKFDICLTGNYSVGYYFVSNETLSALLEHISCLEEINESLVLIALPFDAHQLIH